MDDILRRLLLDAISGVDRRINDLDPNRDVANIARSLVKHTKKNETEAVIFVDNSARLGAVAFREAWKKMNPNSSSMPKTLFISPDGFITKEFLTELDYKGLVELGVKKHVDLQDGKLILSEEGAIPKDAQVEEQLTDFFQKSGLSKNSKVLIFDTCAHSGITLKPIKRGLKMFGAQNVEFGIASKHKCSDRLSFDLIAVDYTPMMSCQPFSPVSNALIQRTQDSIHSSPKMDVPQRYRELYWKARLWMKTAVRDHT